MNTYQRNGRVDRTDKNPSREPVSAPGLSPENQKEQGMRVNGMQQVFDMLRVADSEFRNSLLRRMAAVDPGLVRTLIGKLREVGIY